MEQKKQIVILDDGWLYLFIRFNAYYLYLMSNTAVGGLVPGWNWTTIFSIQFLDVSCGLLNKFFIFWQSFAIRISEICQQCKKQTWI